MAKATTFNIIGIRVLLAAVLLISFVPVAISQTIQRTDAAQFGQFPVCT